MIKSYYYMYLSGDSHPLDIYIEDALRCGLLDDQCVFLGQKEIVDDACAAARCAPARGFVRQEFLVKAVAAAQNSGRQIVLIGRSSGGRLITKLAATGKLGGNCAAIIALGYPFKHPKKPPEPDRVAHLATLSVPTLIVQGRRDHYGDFDSIGHYELSEHISLLWIDSDHGMRLKAAVWDVVVCSIKDFIAQNRNNP